MNIVASFTRLAALTALSFSAGALGDQPVPAVVTTNTPSVSTDGPAAIDRLQAEVHMLIITRQFDKVDELQEQYSSSAERFADGRLKLQGVMSALSMLFPERVTPWQHQYKFIMEWRSTKPRSVMAALAEAQYWSSWAWYARGTGYGSTVSAEGSQLFRERLEKAQAVLDASKDWLASSPGWYSAYIDVGNSLGWPKEKLHEVAAEGLSRHPGYYPIYFSMINALLPRWGGSYRELDAFIDDSVDATKKTEGEALYARLYWRVTNAAGIRVNVFEDTLASWRRMRMGFEELTQHYPESIWLPSNFAAFACRASDVDTYRRLRVQWGENLRPEAFPENLSVEICDKRLMEPAASAL